MYQNKKIKLWKVEVVDDFQNEQEGQLPGQILIADDKQGLYIKTIDGVIKVLEIQGENAKRMNVCDFLRGNKLEVNEILL